MNPIERALGILLLLGSGKLVTATALSERFQVSLRTIYRDVDRLIALGVPVEAERGAEGGYRLAKGYIQPPVALTRRETAALLIVLSVARGLRTTPLAADLETAERKLIASLPRPAQELLTNGERIVGVEPLPPDIFHDSPSIEPNAGWQEALDRFMEGLLEGRRVRFEHHNPSRTEPRAHEVEPLGVIFDRDLWYLAGRSVEADDLRIYRADRIFNMEVSGLRFRPPKEFSVQALLNGAWLSRAMRRWQSEDPSGIILVSDEQARTLARDWYYRHAAFSPAANGKVRITVTDISKERLFPLLRWLGPGAELIEPSALRPLFAAELAAMSAAHQG
ncbi:helix-turn-helix transcriptional regulator [Pannonibacter phragmitetus]|uniref:Transcriptional regulator n=1 Tax=Pannonibacter phragmitetus TaxID=121719 RepID=A0A0U3EK13_9HYPH|nr:WYL domain-containing protein [Pannonibacter phragmitetus]ALV26399.1 transcriptional regulator [Pannonibacter phragmitetus]